MKYTVLGVTYSLRKSRCDDCGFTKGTRANGNGVTAIKAQLCAEALEPFFCHANADDGGQIPEGKGMICRGWEETCDQLRAEGFYSQQTEFQRGLKAEMTDIITEMEDQLRAGTLSHEEATAYVDQRIAAYIVGATK